jgi:trypsin
MRAHTLASVASFSVVLASLVACSASPPDEKLGHTSQNIVGGQSDTTHQAVVAIGLTQGECSGTIIKTDPATGVGWVLSAAHCLVEGGAAQVVIQGDDLRKTTNLQYQVLSGVAHPGYNSKDVQSDHDFSVITIAGVDKDTPTLPIATSTNDGVKVGNTVTSVGYGVTTSGANPTPSDVRKNVTMKITKIHGQDGVAGTTQLEDDRSQSGGTGAVGVPCQGDSGGPVIDASGVVVAVHSYGDMGCTQYITSDRVSSELAWINGELAKAPANDCALCQAKAYSGKNTCAQENAACLADKDCGAINDCANKCAANDNACVQKCFSATPLGLGPLNGVQLCGCNTACATECKTDKSCAGIPKCGFSLKAGKCTTYTEGTCCDELAAASVDKVGFLCLQQTGKYAGCDKNTPYQALLGCQAKSADCATAAGGAGAGGADAGAAGGAAGGDGAGSGDGTGGGSGGTTVTHSGCNESGGSTPANGGLFLAASAVVLGLHRRRARRA